MSIAAFGTGAFLLAFVLLVPFMHGLFMVETLSVAKLGWIVLLACIPTLSIQIVRGIKEQLGKRF